MNRGTVSTILHTNLKSYFWRKVHSVIRQNRKEVLLQFLFQNSFRKDSEDLTKEI